MTALENVCSNVLTFDSTTNTHEWLLKEIDKIPVITRMTGFEAQRYEEDLEDSDIFYIPKYKKVLTFPQVVDFCNQHKDKRFLLMKNGYTCSDDVWFYVETEPNQVTLHFFHYVGGDYLTYFGNVKNVFGESKWDIPQITNKKYCTKILRGVDEPSRRHSYRSSDDNDLIFSFIDKNFGETTSGYPINLNDGYCSSINFHEVLRRSLRITGRTRITFVKGGHYLFEYQVGKKPKKETLSIDARYGIPVNPREEGEYDYGYMYGGNYMFKRHETLDAPIPQDEWERISNRIEAKLLKMDKGDADTYSKILSASVLLITKPIKGHRRPTFHYVRGFRCNEITEIVELSRGELLMKDMMPENIYCLMSDGAYALVNYDFKNGMRELITSNETEIDPVSFNIWAEERSLHPELLTLLSKNYFKTISLDMIKLLNRLPFGALLIEQMTTAGHADLATLLAEYITSRAYDFNFYCSKLEDLFPGCNSEETSLFKILNISRDVAKYLFEDEENMTIKQFCAKYQAIHHYKANMVMTKEARLNIDTYLALVDRNEEVLSLNWGDREFNFLDYPLLAKQVVRMHKKIDALAINDSILRDISNKYDEIVRAYASFLDYSMIAPENEREFWHPEHQMIFLEFSLRGTEENPLDPVEEISSREKAANKALEIYEAKANEKIQRENEEKFAFRKHCINKLRSLVSFEKENKDFSGYSVVAPSQIYGVDVVDSVEIEANKLNHCLFRCYTNRIVEGNYTTMWLRLKDNVSEPLITIGITSDGRIEQTRGRNDRDATPEEARAIAAWAVSKKGMVTFLSEGKDVLPGGWPRTMSVPSLPKPDKDWLKRLSLNHEVAN